jgi:predicted Zn-dependent protease
MSNAAVVAVADDGAALRFDSAAVPANTALADYLRSGWIAGLIPETVVTQTVNGFETASGRARTEQWHFHVSVARADGNVYRFIFANKDDTAAFHAAAQETTSSLRRTQASDLSAIRTVKLGLVRAGGSDNADTLATRMSTLNRGRELFLVVNNLLPGDPVEAGAPYKIVKVE